MSSVPNNVVANYIVDFINDLQRNIWVRRTALCLFLIGLLTAMGYFGWKSLPHHYSVTFCGGGLLDNRHLFARDLAKDLKTRNVTALVVPVSGSITELEMVNANKLDYALVQGGLEDISKQFPHIQHVATLTSETIHLLTKPDLVKGGIKGLARHTVNLGPVGSSTRINTESLMRFSGLELGVDYVATGYSQEDIVALPDDKLPDAAFIISSLPSVPVEEMIKVRGYALMEIPFPKSLALRYGWVANQVIPPYSYNVIPPIPPTSISSVGVTMRLVCNENAPTGATVKILESIFSPEVQAKLRDPMKEADIIKSPDFPLSAGTLQYLKRDEPFLSRSTFEKLQSWFGFLTTIATGALIALKWLKGEGQEEKDKAAAKKLKLKEFLAKSSVIENRIAQLEKSDNLSLEDTQTLIIDLTDLKEQLLLRYRESSDPAIDRMLGSIVDSRNHADIMRNRLLTQKQNSSVTVATTSPSSNTSQTAGETT